MEKLRISQNWFKLAKTSWIWQLRQSSTRLEQYQMSCGKHTSMMWVSSFKFIERHSYQMSSLLVHILSGWKKLSMTRPKLKQSTMNNFTKIEVSQPRNQQGKPSWSQRSLPSQSVSSFKDVPNAQKRSYKLHAQELQSTTNAAAGVICQTLNAERRMQNAECRTSTKCR